VLFRSRTDGAATIAEGITTFPTAGHTPGHVSLELTSNGDIALILGDVLMGGWNFEHVDWVASPEVDPQGAVRTRRAALERAANDGSTIAAYHVDGIGRVEPEGDHFRFVRAPT